MNFGRRGGPRDLDCWQTTFVSLPCGRSGPSADWALLGLAKAVPPARGRVLTVAVHPPLATARGRLQKPLPLNPHRRRQPRHETVRS